MAHLKTSSVLFSRVQYFCTFITTVLLVLSHAKSLSFNFSSMNSNNQRIRYEDDSSVIGGKIQLGSDQDYRIGRASYDTAVPLWDGTTRELASFSTHFSFQIMKLGVDQSNLYADGFAFFLAPFDSRLPVNSTGGCLGLVDGGSPFCHSPSNSSHIVAVEFDIFNNTWDPVGDHVGIDVNSVFSKATFVWEGGFENGTLANVWITYDSASYNLSVFLTFDKNPVFTGESILSYPVDLRTVLPESVRIGFSASTGAYHQLSDIISWEFNSTLLDVQTTPAPQPAVQINTPAPSPSMGVPQPAVQINAPAPSVSIGVPEQAPSASTGVPQPAVQINTPAPPTSTGVPQPAAQINTPAPSAPTGVPTKSMGVPTKSKNKVRLVGGIVVGITIVSFVEWIAPKLILL